MRVVRSIIFNPESVEVQFMETDEVRLEGYVFVTKSMTIARDRDYDDEIEAAETAVADLLADVLEDYAASAPYDPRFAEGDDDDDDDDE